MPLVPSLFLKWLETPLNVIAIATITFTKIIFILLEFVFIINFLITVIEES